MNLLFLKYVKFQDTVPLLMMDQVSEEIGVEALFGLRNSKDLGLGVC